VASVGGSSVTAPPPSKSQGAPIYFPVGNHIQIFTGICCDATLLALRFTDNKKDTGSPPVKKALVKVLFPPLKA